LFITSEQPDPDEPDARVIYFNGLLNQPGPTLRFRNSDGPHRALIQLSAPACEFPRGMVAGGTSRGSRKWCTSRTGRVFPERKEPDMIARPNPAYKAGPSGRAPGQSGMPIL